MALPPASQWWWVNNPRCRCNRCNQWTSNNRWCISSRCTSSSSSRWPWARLLTASSQWWCSNLHLWWCRGINSQVWCNSNLVWWCSQVWLWWRRIQTKLYSREVTPCATKKTAPVQVSGSAWRSFAARTTAVARWCVRSTDPKSALLGTASTGHLSMFARTVSHKLPSAPSSFSCSRLPSAYFSASLSPSRSLPALLQELIQITNAQVGTSVDILWAFQQQKNYYRLFKSLA